MPVADGAQFAQEIRRGRHKSAFALDGLDEDRGHLFRRQDGLEKFLLDVARAAQAECLLVLRPARAAAIDVGIAHVRHARNQRREAALLLRLGAGERQRAHGAPVECAEKRDHLLASGVIARHLERALDGLGAGVAVEEPVRPGHGRHGREPRCQIGQQLVVKIRARDVDQLRGLLLNRSHHFGMAMAGGNHGDARGKVEKFIAVHVFNAHAAPALGHQRIRARIAGRDQPVVGLDGGPRLWPRQLTDEFWSVFRVQFLLGHRKFSSADSVVAACADRPVYVGRCGAATDPSPWDRSVLRTHAGPKRSEDLRRSCY